MDARELLAGLGAVAGADNVSARPADLIAYSADMWPRAQIWKSGGEICRFPPAAVVWVGEREALQRVLQWCHAQHVAVIPYGGGSGVCGGTLPVRGSVVLDVKRMNRLVRIDAESREIVAEAGLVGQNLELALNEAGFTFGHFPSSVYCSTVGGYAAARSAGQFSSRYGTFADMVRDLTVAFPDGTLAHTTPPPAASGAFDWTPVVLGSEGTLAVVVDATIRVHPVPEQRAWRGFQFQDVATGVEAMRRVMQAGLTPCVLRLYDPFDTLIAASAPAPGHAAHDQEGRFVDRLLRGRLAPLVQPLWEDVRSGALQALLARPAALNRMADRLPVGCLLVTGFEGPRGAMEQDAARAWRLLGDAGGRDRGPGPGEAWYQHRYSISFKQSKVFLAGAFVDTMEVSTTWDRLPALYRDVRTAISPHAFVMGHFSHAYREGCSIYFTMVARNGDAAAAERLHAHLWDTGLSATVKAGGSISHHHGIGCAKRAFLADEYGPGGAHAFAALRRAFDPHAIMNPEKLWPAPPVGASRRLFADEDVRGPSSVGAVQPQALTVRVGGSVTLDGLAETLAAGGYAAPWWPVTKGAGAKTVAAALAAPDDLDWGPRMGALHENVLALDGLLPGGHPLRQRVAPRRATGPDVTALLLDPEGRFGTLTGATLRVVPVASRPFRAEWEADDGATLLFRLRALLELGARPARATLTVAARGGARLALQMDGTEATVARDSARLLAVAGSGAHVREVPTDEPWPRVPPTGFAHGIAATWALLRELLAAAAEARVDVLVSRVSSHGGWLVPDARTAGATETALRALREGCPALGAAPDAAFTALGEALAAALRSAGVPAGNQTARSANRPTEV